MSNQYQIKKSRENRIHQDINLSMYLFPCNGSMRKQDMKEEPGTDSVYPSEAGYAIMEPISQKRILKLLKK